MRRQGQGFLPPLPEPKKRADPDPAEPCLVAALSSVQPPLKILFRPVQVHFPVCLAVIGFLIHDEPFGTGLHERPVVFGFHRSHLNRDPGHKASQSLDALG